MLSMKNICVAYKSRSFFTLFTQRSISYTGYSSYVVNDKYLYEILFIPMKIIHGQEEWVYFCLKLKYLCLKCYILL